MSFFLHGKSYTVVRMVTSNQDGKSYLVKVFNWLWFEFISDHSRTYDSRSHHIETVTKLSWEQMSSKYQYFKHSSFVYDSVRQNFVLVNIGDNNNSIYDNEQDLKKINVSVLTTVFLNFLPPPYDDMVKEMTVPFECEFSSHPIDLQRSVVYNRE